MPTVGIHGWPQSGKSTLFALLTRGRGGMTRREGALTLTTAVVPFPDERLEALGRLVGSRSVIPATFTLVDIEVPASLQQKGRSGPLRNVLARMDALLLVVRAFSGAHVPHPLGTPDAQRDMDALEADFLLYDMEVLENRLTRLREEWQKAARPREVIQREREVVERLLAVLREERPLRSLSLTAEERSLMAGFGLLSLKPALVVVNVGEGEEAPALRVSAGTLRIDAPLALERELQQMAPEEAAEFRAMYGLPETPADVRIRKALREVLGLITFYTYNERECRAWLLPRGATAVEAAGRIHSDMARGFIRAEVWPAAAFIQAGGDVAALRRQGLWRVEGRDYVVQDGDILYIRFTR